MHDRDSLHRFLFEQFPIRGHLVHLVFLTPAAPLHATLSSLAVHERFAYDAVDHGAIGLSEETDGHRRRQRSASPKRGGGAVIAASHPKGWVASPDRSPIPGGGDSSPTC